MGSKCMQIHQNPESFPGRTIKSYEGTGDPWSLDYTFYNNGDWALKKKIT